MSLHPLSYVNIVLQSSTYDYVLRDDRCDHSTGTKSLSEGYFPKSGDVGFEVNYVFVFCLILSEAIWPFAYYATNPLQK